MSGKDFGTPPAFVNTPNDDSQPPVAESKSQVS